MKQGDLLTTEVNQRIENMVILFGSRFPLNTLKGVGSPVQINFEHA